MQFIRLATGDGSFRSRDRKGDGEFRPGNQDRGPKPAGRQARARLHVPRWWCQLVHSDNPDAHNEQRC